MLARLNERFVHVADWISWFQGTPINMLLWTIPLAAWFAWFITHPDQASGDPTQLAWLPPWVWEPVVQLPVNGLTTLVELYLAFFIAAAANRNERAAHALSAQQLAILSQMNVILSRLQRDEAAIVVEATKIEAAESEILDRLPEEGI